MKKYALYPGCVMPTEQYSYELSIREVLPILDIELIDMYGFSCCGEPLKSMNKLMTLYLSARNIALAAKQGLDLFVPCPMCHLSLNECQLVLKNDEEMCNRIALINKGKVILEGEPEELSKSYWDHIKIMVTSDRAGEFSSLKDAEIKDNIIEIKTRNLNKTLSEILNLANKKNIEITEIKTVKPSLEEIFFKGVEQNV